MCKVTAKTNVNSEKPLPNLEDSKAPVEKLLDPPSFTARYTCVSILLALFAIWGKLAFVPESEAPGIGSSVHSLKLTIFFTSFYILSLPILRVFSRNMLSDNVDVKLLLRESMILYNAFQVLVNGWMVYRFIDSLLYRGHPFIGDYQNASSGATYAVWIHYCDKYLEFLDTYFMVLRGKMEQVSFLHLYHHISIAFAWWYALSNCPGGDSYFGALLNSWIHVMMYSYYTLSLLKISCPWKKYLTLSQLVQFCTVMIYTVVSFVIIGKTAPDHILSCYYVQLFEMISLFSLFAHFYSKTYKNDKLSKKEIGDSASSDSPDSGSLSSESAQS